jgi:predicted O-methyltransferase YrrM
MSHDEWSAVDDFYREALKLSDPVLDGAVARTAEGGLPAIEVTPHQGKLLHLLARIRGARRILEVGTLGGYSTIWLARALPPGGSLVSLELVPRHAEVARANLATAGLAEVATVRVGPALASLDALIAEQAAPFDFVFIDADKASTPDYFTRALALSAVGTILVIDNVVRAGRVLLAGSSNDVDGIRRAHELIANEPRVSATAIQTVGSKGWDGFTLALVVS